MKGRDLEGVVHAGQAAVNKAVHCRPATAWNGAANTANCSKRRRNSWSSARSRCLLIFLILFALYGNFKFPITIALGVVLTEPVGALIALKLTHTPFSVSSFLGLLALLGVSVETAVILVSYINKLRLEGMSIRDATLGPRCCACAPS